MGEILYKYVPILPHLRGNLLRILERRSIFFSRKRYLNDPIDCEPRIDIDLPDKDLVALVHRSCKVIDPHFHSHFGLPELSRELKKYETNPEILDEPYFEGLLGLSKVSEAKALFGSSSGHPLRQIAKRALSEFCRYQISEPYIFSLSETPTYPLLWGHYAQGHSGICIGFSGIESPNAGWNKERVEYSNRRPTVSAEDIVRISEGKRISSEILHSIFFKKSENWRNEKEVRLVARPQEIASGSVDLTLPEGAYVPVRSIQIDRIIFGARCSDLDRYSIKSIIQQKCEYARWPKLLQAHFADDSYDIKIKELEEEFGTDVPLGKLARALLENGVQG
jgi:hypothetical protein